MTRPLSNDIRERLVSTVDAGLSRRSAAKRYGVAASTAIKWVDQWHRTGDAGPSLNVSVPTGLSSAVSIGFDAGVSISTSDGSLSLGYIGLSFAPGGGDIVADFAVSATTDIELLPVPLRRLRGKD